MSLISQSNVSYVVALVEVDEGPWCVRDDEDNDHAGQKSHHGPVTSAKERSIPCSFRLYEVFQETKVLFVFDE